MAVINAEVQDTVVRTANHGGEVIAMTAQFEVAAADSDGSIYRLFKVNKNMVPIRIDINCDAITGATGYNLGLYETLENGGAVKVKDVFMDSADISAGKALGSEQNGLSALAIDEIGDQIYSLAGETGDAGSKEYDVAITADTVGTGTGTISVRALFAKSA
jgi:hypothetical protein